MNFYELLLKVSNLKWSTNDPEPKTFDDILMSSKIAFQQAMIEVWNADDFLFKNTETYVVLNEGQNIISPPFGSLKKVFADNHELIPFSESVENTSQTGTPIGYLFETGNLSDRICIYPIPEKKTEIKLMYESMYMAVDREGNPKFNLEQETDEINIKNPVYLELFINAVVLLTQCNLIQDTGDENFIPYQNAYERALNILKMYQSNYMKKRIVI